MIKKKEKNVRFLNSSKGSTKKNNENNGKYKILSRGTKPISVFEELKAYGLLEIICRDKIKKTKRIADESYLAPLNFLRILGFIPTVHHSIEGRLCTKFFFFFYRSSICFMMMTGLAPFSKSTPQICIYFEDGSDSLN